MGIVTKNNLYRMYGLFELCVTKTAWVADNTNHLPVDYERMRGSFSLGWDRGKSDFEDIIVLMMKSHDENPFEGECRFAEGPIY